MGASAAERGLLEVQDWIAKGVDTEGGSKSEPRGVPVQRAATEEEDTGKGLEEHPAAGEGGVLEANCLQEEGGTT